MFFFGVLSGFQYLTCPDQGGSPCLQWTGGVLTALERQGNPSFWNFFSSGLVVLSSLSVSLPRVCCFHRCVFEVQNSRLQFFFYFSSAKLSSLRLLTSFVCDENSAFLCPISSFSLISVVLPSIDQDVVSFVFILFGTYSAKSVSWWFQWF